MCYQKQKVRLAKSGTSKVVISAAELAPSCTGKDMLRLPVFSSPKFLLVQLRMVFGDFRHCAAIVFQLVTYDSIPELKRLLYLLLRFFGQLVNGVKACSRSF